MVIKLGDQKQLTKELPQSQLTKEQNDKNAQPKPLVFKRNIDKSKGVNVHPRK